ncbi:UDP-N-acetylglucosamine 2-epimerase (non-hydrolyzing) [Halobacteriales archaeon QS_4_62_28]|nr:MAG: UDP-N-acetylglucosamine 2-epimerase (non-hydrolyzing) [Halobacteriales archaeon QS_4_62_28]
MKVLTVVGARPQFIKSFPVTRALQPDHDEVLVHTGQHYDQELSDVFFEELDLRVPDHNLGVGSSTHAVQTGEMMRRLDPIVAAEAPDVILLYGDTNSTIAGALVGANRDTTVAHVEAGLRSGERSMPEEINRIVTDHVADVLCTPCEAATRNLEREGIADRASETGDVMYDAIKWADRIAHRESDIVERLGVDDDPFVLATVHRPRNTDDPDRLNAIVEALLQAPAPVVFPVHPRTEAALRDQNRWAAVAEGLECTDPVGYLDFVRLLDGAQRVVTDSGGVQKEAFFLETPCVTLREETEWTETVQHGWNALVGAGTERILDAIAAPFDAPAHPQPYGDGSAAERIVEVLATE